MANHEGVVSIQYTPAGGTALPIASRAVSGSIWVRTGPLDLNQDLPNGRNSSRLEKYVDALIAEIENISFLVSAKLKIKGFDRLNEYDPSQTIIWDEEFAIDSNSENEEPFWPRLTNRYFVLELEDEFPTGQWKWSAAEFYGRVMRGRM